MQRLSYILIVFSFLGCQTRNGTQDTIQQNSLSKVDFAKPVKFYKITQRFKPASNPKHKGIDLAGRKNSPIFSTAQGRVVYVGKKFSGYGLLVLVKHKNGYSSLYSHLNKAFVSAGKTLKKGQLIGAMGKTGRASGVHLHFELMKNKIPINPELFINF